MPCFLSEERSRNECLLSSLKSCTKNTIINVFWLAGRWRSSFKMWSLSLLKLHMNLNWHRIKAFLRAWQRLIISTLRVSKMLWNIKLLSILHDTARMYLKFGQITECFYHFLFKMGLIGASPPCEVIDAITLILITTVIITRYILGWKHCKSRQSGTI